MPAPFAFRSSNSECKSLLLTFSLFVTELLYPPAPALSVDRQADLLSRAEINNELEFRWLLDGKSAGLAPLST